MIEKVKEICKFPSQEQGDKTIEGLRWIGLFSDRVATARPASTLDALCAELEKRLTYQPGERDLVMLQHKFNIEWKDGSKVPFCTPSSPTPTLSLG